MNTKIETRGNKLRAPFCAWKFNKIITRVDGHFLIAAATKNAFGQPLSRTLQLNGNCKTIARQVEPIEDTAGGRPLPPLGRKNNRNPGWNNQKYKRRYCLARDIRGKAGSRAGSRQLSATRHPLVCPLWQPAEWGGRRLVYPSLPRRFLSPGDVRSTRFTPLTTAIAVATTGAVPAELNSGQ